MARYLKSSLYIHLLPHTIIQLSPFISHLKITLRVMLKQRSNHFIVQSLSQHPLKASAGKSNARMYNSFISQEKERKSNQKKCAENILLETYFCYLWLWRAGVWARGALWRASAVPGRFAFSVRSGEAVAWVGSVTVCQFGLFNLF